MCTAMQITGAPNFFGRTLDAKQSYGEGALFVPKGAPLAFLHEAALPMHQAMLGVGILHEKTPLYFDAVNDAGLAGAALRFAHSAAYHAPRAGMHNAASFEIIPWVLAKCRTITEAAALLSRTNITPESVSPAFPAEPLHFLFADRSGAIAAEPLAGGLTVKENPFGVLTNEPPFAFHAAHAALFRQLSAKTPANTFCPEAPLAVVTGGLGGMGLPGDFSSPSRFLRAAFLRAHAENIDSPGAFFHLTDALTVPRGCTEEMHTLWASCYDLDACTLHVTSAACRRIQSARMDAFSADAPVWRPFADAEDERELRG